MSSIRNISETEVILFTPGYINFGLIEENIVRSCAYANSHTPSRTAFEREIIHEIDIETARKSFGMDRIRSLRPAIVPKLQHKMVIRTIRKIDLTPVFF